MVNSQTWRSSEQKIKSNVIRELPVFKYTSPSAMFHSDYNNETYVNTTLSGSRISAASPFELPPAIDSSAQTNVFFQTDVTVEITSFSSLISHYASKACERSLVEKGILGKCSLTQKQVNMPTDSDYQIFYSSCQRRYSKTLHVTMYHSMVVKLLDMVNSAVCVQTCEVHDITEVTLECLCVVLKSTQPKIISCNRLLKTGFNNVVLPTLFHDVNNIVQHCYTRSRARFRLNNLFKIVDNN